MLASHVKSFTLGKTLPGVRDGAKHLTARESFEKVCDWVKFPILRKQKYSEQASSPTECMWKQRASYQFWAAI